MFYSSNPECDAQFENVLNFTKLAALLFGMDPKEIASQKISDVERKVEARYNDSRRLCLDHELVKRQLTQLLQSPTFQMDIQKIFRDTQQRKQRFLMNISKLENPSKDVKSSVPKTRKNLKDLKRAKMKAKQRVSGFRTNIYFKSNFLDDNSKIKTMNDEFAKEITRCWSEGAITLPSDTSRYSQPRSNLNEKSSKILEMMMSKGGHITKCIEAACNGSDNGTIFESIVGAAIHDADNGLISIMKESQIILTPNHVLIRTQDISQSLKLSNFAIKEISIDEFQQIIVIDNSIRLFNFYTSDNLQQFLVLLEYLIRKNASKNCKNMEKRAISLMRPRLWNELLNCKERIMYANIDVKVTWHLYALQKQEEFQRENNSGLLLTRSRSEIRALANFKFYGCRNTYVMEISKQKTSDFQSAYFEVK